MEIGDGRVRAGFIGEVGTERGRISSAEERVLRAAAQAQRRTGVSIWTHTTNGGDLALEQVALLTGAGVPVGPDRRLASRRPDHARAARCDRGDRRLSLDRQHRIRRRRLPERRRPRRARRPPRAGGRRRPHPALGRHVHAERPAGLWRRRLRARHHLVPAATARAGRGRGGDRGDAGRQPGTGAGDPPHRRARCGGMTLRCRPHQEVTRAQVLLRAARDGHRPGEALQRHDRDVGRHADRGALRGRGAADRQQLRLPRPRGLLRGRHLPPRHRRAS